MSILHLSVLFTPVRNGFKNGFCVKPIPPPPLSPLFPYTTLSDLPIFSILGPEAALYQLTGKIEPRVGSRSNNTDRKSTRLNSSHLGSSYAVFCLKKKNRLFNAGENVQEPRHPSDLDGVQPAHRIL